jgi:dipeptidyl aminopeptidase/acylaminoacyl peptidase
MRLIRWTALLLAAAASLPAARFGIEHIGRIVRLNDPQISPDGKSIAVVVSRTNYEEDRYDPQLVLIDVATHAQRVLTRDRRGMGQARWSPDCTRLAFLASADGKTQIFGTAILSHTPCWQMSVLQRQVPITSAFRTRVPLGCRFSRLCSSIRAGEWRYRRWPTF